MTRLTKWYLAAGLIAGCALALTVVANGGDAKATARHGLAALAWLVGGWGVTKTVAWAADTVAPRSVVGGALTLAALLAGLVGCAVQVWRCWP